MATSTASLGGQPLVQAPRRLQQRGPHRLECRCRRRPPGATTPWKVDRGLPNCSRAEVYSAASRVASSHTPELDSGRAPTQRAVDGRRPDATSSSRGSRHRSVEREVADAARGRSSSARSTDTPAAAVSTRKTPTPSPRRRGTSTASATWPAGTLRPGPAAGVHSPSAVDGLTAAGTALGAGYLERRGEHGLARDDAGQPAGLLAVGAELGERSGRPRPWASTGTGATRRPCCLEHEADLDEPEPAAAVGLGQRDAEQAGVGELLPELAVDAVLAGLDLLHPLDGHRARGRPARPARARLPALR